jgi:hypothetical protein
LYGEDGLDVTKHRYLTRFDFSARNYRALLAKYRPAEALAALEQERGTGRARPPTNFLHQGRRLTATPMCSTQVPSATAAAADHAQRHAQPVGPCPGAVPAVHPPRRHLRGV